MISSRCKNCTWLDQVHETLKDIPKNLGYCRKKYPIIVLREGKYYGQWPLVDVTDICGEFRQEVQDGLSGSSAPGK